MLIYRLLHNGSSTTQQKRNIINSYRSENFNSNKNKFIQLILDIYSLFTVVSKRKHIFNKMIVAC